MIRSNNESLFLGFILVLGIILVGCDRQAGPHQDSNETFDTVQPFDQEDEGVNFNVTATKDMVAELSFDFNPVKTVYLNFSRFPSEFGKINIYKRYEYHNEQSNTFYPDHRSMLASYIASTDTLFSLALTEQDQYLILEWLPMDGLSDEAYRRLDIESASQYTVGF